MGDTKIEWTQNPDGTKGKTWNPVTGCTKISLGCQNCYAERMAKRLAGRYGYPAENPFAVTLHPERLGEPDKWKGIWKKHPPKPSRIFVCSMGDLFHDDVPNKFLVEVFDVMWMSQYGKYMTPTDPHTFMILTKRPENALKFMNYALRRWSDKPFPNVWWGVTCENQEQADKRIPILLEIPAAVRFVSVEPMLGPIKFNIYWLTGRPCFVCECEDKLGKPRGSMSHPINCGWRKDTGQGDGGIDQVICGGETGPGARPVHPDWIRSLRDQSQASGTSFFFKSWGDWLPVAAPRMGIKDYLIMTLDGTTRPGNWSDAMSTVGEEWAFAKVGKKAAGRLLDGKTWDEIPGVQP